MNTGSPKPGGENSSGMGGLLTTLASKGDKWVQLLIVGGIIVNGWMTKTNSTEIRNNETHIKTNTAEIDKLREQALKQVKVLYDNQIVWAAYMDETRFALDRLQEKLAVPHPYITPYPRQEVDDPK